MRSRRRLLSGNEGPAEVWPAFTDVMSTLALIMFVLVLLAYVRNLESGRRLGALEKLIANSEQQLQTLRGEIASGKAQLASSRDRLREQQAVIVDNTQELDTLRARLQSIAVLRVEVLGKLKRAIEAELGATSDAGVALVTIGDNGNIVINESLVFEYGSYAVKPEAKPLLDTIARALGRILGDDSVRENVDTILIQGHTDERGSATYNWDLSARRATAVLNYLFEANHTLADTYGGYFAAAAYSKFRPLDPAENEDAFRRNRRIEIALVPKDASVQKIIEDYEREVAAPVH